MSLSQFAKWIYSFRPMLDREARNSWRAYNMMGVDDIYRDHLKEIA